MKQTQIKTASDMARELVGDGKRPNKYFVTIGYGWYMPSLNAEEAIQASNSIDSVTIMFNDKEAAKACYEAIEIPYLGLSQVTGETIGQVMIEDRLTGVIKEKILIDRGNGNFWIRKD